MTVVADGRFQLTGTPAQNAILQPIFEPGSPSFISFPWALMDDLPRYPVTIGWDDLNDGTLGLAHHHATVQDFLEGMPVFSRVRDENGNGHAISRPGSFLGLPEKRLAIAGVFWSDGRIKIDIRMEARPDDAREVCSAELAHAVDYGLPLTPAMKTRIMLLLHEGVADEHTWWERSSYGAEYYTLAGESFMALFTHAYSEMEPWQTPFTHKSTKAIAAQIPAILGAIPTTDVEVGLTARAWRTTFGNGRAELTWTGATGASVTVYRNGLRLMTTVNDGRFVNNLRRKRGSFRYWIVDAKGRRSNAVTVTV